MPDAAAVEATGAAERAGRGEDAKRADHWGNVVDGVDLLWAWQKQRSLGDGRRATSGPPPFPRRQSRRQW